MAQGGEQEVRVSVTFSLPTRLADAVLEAARAAGRIDAQGRVRMDHMLLASPDRLEPLGDKGGSHWRVLLERYLKRPFEGASKRDLHPL